MTPVADPAFNPAWLIALVALVSFATSIVTLLTVRRNKRSEIEHALAQQRDSINLAFAQYKVRSPFAHLVDVPEAELEVFTPKLCLFFLQLNHLNNAYLHRELLPSDHMPSYEAWIRNILGPWIQSDRHLVDSLRVIYETDDIMRKDFVDWLKPRIRIDQSHGA